jgi:hypothetical protein
MISKAEIRRLYATASKIGFVGNDHNDGLHITIYNMFKKESVKELSEKEYKKTLEYLENLTNGTKNGMITNRQINCVYALISELAKLTPSGYKVNQRLAGVVKKVLKVEVSSNKPLKGLTKEQGQKLINALKLYIKSEKNKIERTGSVDKSKSNYP